MDDGYQNIRWTSAAFSDPTHISPKFQIFLNQDNKTVPTGISMHWFYVLNGKQAWNRSHDQIKMINNWVLHSSTSLLDQKTFCHPIWLQSEMDAKNCYFDGLDIFTVYFIPILNYFPPLPKGNMVNKLHYEKVIAWNVISNIFLSLFLIGAGEDYSIRVIVETFYL